MAISVFAQAGKGQPSSFPTMIGILAVMFVVMYFFMIRPERKKQKDKQMMINKMQKGNKAMTIGGIHGTIQNVKEDAVILKVAENTNIKVAKTAISNVIIKDSDKNGTGEKKK
jgi:preprotein translocase subunit YajC